MGRIGHANVGRQQWRFARRLTAALAVAKKEGAGVHVVPAKETHVGSFDIYKRGHEDGWNECRAATLAGRVWP